MIKASDSGGLPKSGRQKIPQPTTISSVVPNTVNISVRDYFDKTEMKIKDAQIKRLQERVKESEITELSLNRRITELSKNDKNLVNILDDAQCFSHVVFEMKLKYELTFAFESERISDLADRLRISLDEEGITTILSKGSHDKSKKKLKKPRNTMTIHDKQSLLNSEFDFVVQSEFNLIYEYLSGSQNFTSLVKEYNQMTAFMILRKDGNRKLLEFYTDAYLTRKLDVFFELQNISIIFLGLQFTIHDQNFTYIKLVEKNEETGMRNVFILGVQSDHISKWISFLDECLIGRRNLDKPLREIKKVLCKMKNIDYNKDSTDDECSECDHHHQESSFLDSKHDIDLKKLMDRKHSTPNEIGFSSKLKLGLAMIEEKDSSQKASSRVESMSQLDGSREKKFGLNQEALNMKL